MSVQNYISNALSWDDDKAAVQKAFDFLPLYNYPGVTGLMLSKRFRRPERFHSWAEAFQAFGYNVDVQKRLGRQSSHRYSKGFCTANA